MSDARLTSETGLAGHPDKVADQIGDAVLDAYLACDADSRVGCQVMVANGLIVIGGQISSRADIDIGAVAKTVLQDIGYEENTEGLSPQSEIIVRINPQSRNIAKGVDRGGAGDSAIVIGFACADTPQLMPMSTEVVHRIAEAIDVTRRGGSIPWLRPDGKVQATVSYENGEPAQVETFVLSVQHTETVSPSELAAHLWAIIKGSDQPGRIDINTQLLTAATFGFSVGGPKADCGLSGRKVIADTYGGVARHGGGGLSGKDPTKIDRCGMYGARYIAKNLVAAGLARRCEVQLAYVIGEEMPCAISVNSFGTALVPEDRLAHIVRNVFPLRPPAIVEALRLKRPIYRQAGIYGHFGHELPECTWECCDRVADLKASA